MTARHLTRCLFLLAVLFCELTLAHSCAQESDAEKKETPGAQFALVIHGGTLGDPNKMTAEHRAAADKTLRQALEIGKGVLDKNGRSLDAVEQVIRFLEDDPTFNAGRGAVLNAAGKHELDASIMDGRTRQCGAVASVKTIKNPITLARLVMTRTRHVLLVADGAEQFAAEQNVDRVPNSYFATPDRVAEWQRNRGASGDRDDPAKKGTVGCVALDRFGHLAAGTSTGGLNNKMLGRVGDSPIVGAGTYADDSTCAVSCTGVGEQFIRNAVAYDVSAQMKYGGKSLTEAVAQIIEQTLRANDGGIIAVGRNGEVAIGFNTPGMSRAVADSSGRFEVQVGR